MDRVTSSSTGDVSSAPAAAPVMKDNAGGASSSVMVQVAVVMAPRVLLPGPVSSTCTVSSVSSRASFITVTSMVSTVLPAVKVRVPELSV